jgi:mannosyltransferase OCH1-like enzyme
MRTWTERDLWPLRNQSEFDQAATPAQRADILRLEVLSRYGGIYVDTDFEPLRALDGLVTSDCFFAREDNRWVAIGIIGSRPGHPFIDHLIERLPDSVRSRSGISEQTGPKFVTRELWTWRAKPADTPTVYPPELFYPYHFSQPNRRAGPFPGAYAVHHWAGSWTTS